MKNPLIEIAAVFFKLGCFAFGGPAAHIAMMEEEIIVRRKWMSQQHFLDLIGATNLIPGPNSTEMTMHCGHERGGKAGLFIAGLAFIFPAVFITGFLGYLYVTYGKLPNVEPFIIGIKPAVLAVIASAIIKLGKKALKGIELGILGALVIVASFTLGVSEVLILLGAGIFGMLYFYLRNNSSGKGIRNILPFVAINVPMAVTGKITTLSIFLTFLKVGAILYGSGYVLFAYLDAELVETGWLTRKELIDAIAVGQFTPGPVLSTATFIGYQLNGLWGSIAASAGIFLPSFFFVLILNPIIPKLRKSKLMGYFLDSVNIAAVGIMLAVLVQMGMESVVDWRTIVIAILSFILTFSKIKLNPMWIILIGSVLGFLLYL